MQKQHGFTLMEMIGVMAVIAILASIATPTIIGAIRDAKITTFVENSNSLRSAVAQFYEDTGRFPVHVQTSTNQNEKQLMKNTSTPLSGWDGPYIEKKLQNSFSEGSYIAVLSTNNANYQFDLDGDGTVDTTNVSVLRVDQVTDSIAKKISDIIDNDGDVTSGSGSWKASGKVKRYGTASNHATILLIHISHT